MRPTIPGRRPSFTATAPLVGYSVAMDSVSTSSMMSTIVVRVERGVLRISSAPVVAVLPLVRASPVSSRIIYAGVAVPTSVPIRTTVEIAIPRATSAPPATEVVATAMTLQNNSVFNNVKAERRTHASLDDVRDWNRLAQKDSAMKKGLLLVFLAALHVDCGPSPSSTPTPSNCGLLPSAPCSLPGECCTNFCARFPGRDQTVCTCADETHWWTCTPGPDPVCCSGMCAANRHCAP